MVGGRWRTRSTRDRNVGDQTGEAIVAVAGRHRAFYDGLDAGRYVGGQAEPPAGDDDVVHGCSEHIECAVLPRIATFVSMDGMVGQQVFSGEATRLAYMTDEAEEGRDAFLEKRKPNWDDYPWIG